MWEPGPAKYGSVIVNALPVTMGDGFVLKATVAYPADLGNKERAPGSSRS